MPDRHVLASRTSATARMASALKVKPSPTVAEGMGFETALTMLKLGYRASRQGWNGRGMYLFLVPSWAATGVEEARLPFLAMRTVQGAVVPWLASQTDLLAHDWLVTQNDGTEVVDGADGTPEGITDATGDNSNHNS
jgi:hypothetical protein